MQDRFRFRAAIKEDKYSKIEFAYSDYDDDYNEERLVGDLRLSLEGNKCYIYRWDWIEYEDYDKLEWVDLYGVEIISLEQCTGLKDKNGKLIYEGDIIVKSDVSAIGYSRTRVCKVHWHNDWLSWAITTQYGDTYELSEFEPQQYEIIGNIHENADLLEVQDELL